MSDIVYESFQITDPKEIEQYYDKWAKSYDNDLANRNYNGPKYMLELVKKYLKTSDLILIVGAGTGLEAVLLRENGYCKLHGHDGSEDMLNQARKRGLFEEYYHELLEPGKASQLKKAHYDAMICMGCFVPGCLDERHVDDLLETVKPGGIAIIATREMFVKDPGEKYNYPYNLDTKLKKLEEEGKTKLLERKLYERYTENLNGIFYVYQVVY